jgi:hypothetical protein
MMNHHNQQFSGSPSISRDIEMMKHDMNCEVLL